MKRLLSSGLVVHVCRRCGSIYSGTPDQRSIGALLARVVDPWPLQVGVRMRSHTDLCGGWHTAGINRGSGDSFDGGFIMFATLRRLVWEDEAAAMVEYALLVALIALASIVALGALGTSIRDMWVAITGQVDAAKPAP